MTKKHELVDRAQVLLDSEGLKGRPFLGQMAHPSAAPWRYFRRGGSR